MLIRYKEEQNYELPVLEKNANAATKAEWNVARKEYGDKVKKYKDNKSHTFIKTINHCDEALKSYLKALPDFKTWDKASDVITLLNKIESIALGEEGEEPPFAALHRSIRQVFTTHQEGGETIQQYSRKYKSDIKGLEAMWGEPFVPPKLANSTPKEKEAARQQVFAYGFIKGAVGDARERDLFSIKLI